MHFILKQEVFDGLKSICKEVRRSREKMPMELMLMKMMDMQGLPMHCPYHHFIVPAALLTQVAIDEKTTEDEFNKWLELAEARAKTVPAGFCGECGACGAAVGIGIFISVYTKATPKSEETWQWANEATGLCLREIASYKGPRCCKRTSFLAVKEGVPYVNDKCGTSLISDEIKECLYHDRNAECLEESCPFYGGLGKENTQLTAIVAEKEMMPERNSEETCKCMKESAKADSQKGIITWLVTPGQHVKAGEVLCEGEVEKKVIEFTAPYDGILAEQCIKDGQVFTAGTVLGYIKLDMKQHM